jgi:hypothetical protein
MELGTTDCENNNNDADCGEDSHDGDSRSDYD